MKKFFISVFFGIISTNAQFFITDSQNSTDNRELTTKFVDFSNDIINNGTISDDNIEEITKLLEGQNGIVALQSLNNINYDTKSKLECKIFSIIFDSLKNKLKQQFIRYKNLELKLTNFLNSAKSYQKKLIENSEIQEKSKEILEKLKKEICETEISLKIAIEFCVFQSEIIQNFPKIPSSQEIEIYNNLIQNLEKIYLKNFTRI